VRKTPRTSVLRGLGFALAIVLGGVGVWLIVTGGNSTQRIEIGVLIGLWGLLIGAICGRRLVSADPSVPPVPAPGTSTELAVPDTAVQRAQSAAAQRAFEAGLQEMLRRELANAVDHAVTREISELRAEIAHLRQELLDKVGGELRLERIETTRLIGSDLEAMRAEVRRLQLANEQVVDGHAEPAPGPPRTAQLSAPAAASTVEPAGEPVIVPQPSTGQRQDPFAYLPRLTPLADLGLDEPEPPPAPPTPAEADYAGRRRAAEAAPAGHLAPDDAPHDEEASRRRHRHRRADDPQGQELLARLLAREGVRR
jgi:hypothetical protein